jgi:hypothetical protein
MKPFCNHGWSFYSKFCDIFLNVVPHGLHAFSALNIPPLTPVPNIDDIVDILDNPPIITMSVDTESIGSDSTVVNNIMEIDTKGLHMLISMESEKCKISGL